MGSRKTTHNATKRSTRETSNQHYGKPKFQNVQNILIASLTKYLKIKFLTLFQDQNVENDVLNLTSPDRYELSWFLPEDNGIPIDFFEVSFYPVTYDTSKMRWERHGNLFRTEIPHPGNVRYLITNLYPNTHHLIEIRAHNQEGYSTSSALVIKTARGEFLFSVSGY